MSNMIKINVPLADLRKEAKIPNDMIIRGVTFDNAKERVIVKVGDGLEPATVSVPSGKLLSGIKGFPKTSTVVKVGLWENNIQFTVVAQGVPHPSNEPVPLDAWLKYQKPAAKEPEPQDEPSKPEPEPKK